MKIDIIDVMPNIDIEQGIYTSGVMQIQTTQPPYDNARVEIVLSGTETAKIINGEISKETMAEQKLVDFYEFDIQKIDKFDIEKYQRELASKDEEIETLKGAISDLAVLMSNAGGGENAN